MTRLAQAERQALADILLDTGPDQPTLCDGWTTRDIAAHLVVRDRRVDTGLAVLLPLMGGHDDRVRSQFASRPYAELIALLRAAPWWSPLSNPLLEPLTNTLELFVHHEDVRRCGKGWRPRVLAPDQERALWAPTRVIGWFNLRRSRTPVLLDAPGYGQATLGSGGERVRVVGRPSELAMFVTGRQGAADVQLDGPPEAVARLRAAHLSL